MATEFVPPPSGLATLAAGAYGFGRFYAAYGKLDDDDELEWPVADEYIDWSGTTPLVPAQKAP